MSFSAPVAAMVGRDAELALLREALRRAAGGEASSVLVAGEAGIGKSRLVGEFRAAAGGEATVLVGWCLDYGSTPAPYGPLPALLRGVLAELGERADEAAGPGRDALRVLLPELSAAPFDRSAVGPELLREAIANVMEAAADRGPLVLVIEDLHWADEATLSILAFLLRVLAGRPVLFVLTCRIDEVRRGGAVSRFLAEAERARLVDRIPLHRLDDSAVRAMVEHLSGPIDAASLARMQERAEGVPFFVEELACNAQGPLPETLRDVLLARFDLLSDDAKRVVRAVSGAEGGVSHELLLALVPLSDEKLDEAIREATMAAILIVREGETYGFRHALLREAVHDDLLPGERARLHRAYAEALEEAGARTPGACIQPTLAFHWHQAHDPRRALVAAVGAMMQSKASYAFSTAARFGELALELWEQVPDAADVAGIERMTLLARLGSILRNAGDGERALAVVDQALAETDPAAADAGAYVRLLRDKALYLQHLGRPGSVELLTGALAIMDARLEDDRLRATLLNYLASRHMIAGRLDEGIAVATEAYERATSAGAEREMSVARNIRGSCRAHLGDLVGGLEDYGVAREYARDDASMLRYRVNFSDLLIMLGRYREAVGIAEEGLAHAKHLGVQRTSGAIMTQNMVEPLLERGEIGRAEELLATDLNTRTLRVFRLYTTMSRVQALAWRGRLDEAAAVLREWLPSMEQTAVVERQVWYFTLKMESAVAVGRGDWNGAFAVLRRMLADPGPALGYRRRLLLDGGWIVASLRALGDGQADEAAELVRRGWAELPESLQGPSWSALLSSLLAPTEASLRQAVVMADGDDVPAVFRVVVRQELARILVASGDRGEASELLTEAGRIADELGNDRLRQDVGAFVAASGLGDHGAPVLPRADGGPELTAREQQVLALVAEGLSNRQIGERLFISAKTASVHVSAILRKLGVTTRTEAAVAISRRSPAPDEAFAAPLRS
ncbi:DNA-binding NarL/FixJ family response regulator [Microbacterium resistens]|uniref:DNA-binding NarL/FixJ family response regulator n=1 Tax=Microbacterium resistens TaxID=156977 RepID=A0ABU1SCY4_9MICO|nr:AAA family ATPase [Microbacterium resistens]MDR6866768.1 DNA-binding NarL/FixJ family response regulator [Microbacterium resistens]